MTLDETVRYLDHKLSHTNHALQPYKEKIHIGHDEDKKIIVYYERKIAKAIERFFPKIDEYEIVFNPIAKIVT